MTTYPRTLETVLSSFTYDPMTISGARELIVESIRGWNTDGRERRATMRNLLQQLFLAEAVDDIGIGLVTRQFLADLIRILRPNK